MTTEEILSRFVLEPRCGFWQKKELWLVVFDTKTGRYLQEGRKYKQFKTSKDAFEYIKNSVV